MMPEGSGEFNELDPKLRKQLSAFIREEVQAQVKRKQKQEERIGSERSFYEEEQRQKLQYEVRTEKNKGDTGPIDSKQIREMTEAVRRTTKLSAKQKEKHERTVAYVENEPIKFKRLVKSFHFAVQGFIYVWRTQPNMKIHTIVAALAILFGFLFHISAPEWLVIILVIGLVVMLEVINTAIETLVDLYTEDFSFLAGVSKDLGATTVLIMAVTAVIVGCVIFLPKIIALIQTFM